LKALLAPIKLQSGAVEKGHINASVRSANAYNTDSEIIPSNRFNVIPSAQVAPHGRLVSGSTSVFKPDGSNWEDAPLTANVSLHWHWPGLRVRRRYPESDLPRQRLVTFLLVIRKFRYSRNKSKSQRIDSLIYAENIEFAIGSRIF
jgi:hypothetical protein